MELTSKQRAFLRSKATKLDAIFQIGKSGVNENMLQQIDNALAAREMIKCSVLETCELPAATIGDGIAAAVDATVVTVIGSKIVFFKISPEHRQYDLLALKMIEKEEVSKPKKKPQFKPDNKAGKNFKIFKKR